MLFKGRKQRSLDPKKRLMLPPEFRDILLSRCAEGKLVMTINDHCLQGFPLPDWEEFEQAMLKMRNPSPKVRNFRRRIIGRAEELTLDKQGRILLSSDHCEYAELDDKVYIVGQLQKFEIWNPERYDTDVMEQEDIGDDVAAELEAQGIAVPL